MPSAARSVRIWLAPACTALMWEPMLPVTSARKYTSALAGVVLGGTVTVITSGKVSPGFSTRLLVLGLMVADAVSTGPVPPSTGRGSVGAGSSVVEPLVDPAARRDSSTSAPPASSTTACCGPLASLLRTAR